MKIKIAAILLISLGNPFSAHAGVVMGGTRVIYPQGQRETAFSVTNMDTDSPYLIQSWIENIDNHNTSPPPFVVTPSLFRLDAGQKNTLRISYLGTPLPADRESVFWLNIKNIAPAQKANSNKLQINVKSKFKLFYRPEGLKGNPQLAWQQLTFSCRGDRLIVRNPTPYFVSFYRLTVGSHDVDAPGMVSPLSERDWRTSCAGAISWQAINDFGGVTRPATQA